MKTATKTVKPDDFILSIFSPEERLDAAMRVAKEAFKKTRLTIKDIDNAVRTVRRKAYEKKK